MTLSYRRQCELDTQSLHCKVEGEYSARQKSQAYPAIVCHVTFRRFMFTIAPNLVTRHR